MKADNSDLAAQALRAGPAAAGAVASAITLSEWVAVITIIYITVQVGYLVWKWTWESREKRAAFEREARREQREERTLAAAEAREALRKADEAVRCALQNTENHTNQPRETA